MGYDLHITRASDWADNTDREISQEEWRAVVESDPELEAQAEPEMAAWRDTWFRWDSGSITTKNPSEAVIEKAMDLAVQLRATVQGDDGEMYGPGIQEKDAEGPPLTLGDRLANLKNTLAWNLWTRWTIRCPFRVGGRVRDSSGREGVVVALNPRAEHGAGIVTVRFDDGADLTSLLIAPGVEAVDEK